MAKNNTEKMNRKQCLCCNKQFHKKTDISIHFVYNPKCLEFADLSEIHYPIIYCPLCKNKKKTKFDDLKKFKSHLQNIHKEPEYNESINKNKVKIVKEVKAKDGIDKVSLNSKLLEAKHSARRHAKAANELADKECKKILLESEVEDFKRLMQREPKEGSVIK